eukprot:scaffold18185_cov49-Phaeocystis_antarctica.AAC.4
MGGGVGGAAAGAAGGGPRPNPQPDGPGPRRPALLGDPAHIRASSRYRIVPLVQASPARDPSPMPKPHFILTKAIDAPPVDPERMAAVGYCFGGRCVLTLTLTPTPTLSGASSTWHRANPDLTVTLTLPLALALALALA